MTLVGFKDCKCCKPPAMEKRMDGKWLFGNQGLAWSFASGHVWKTRKFRANSKVGVPWHIMTFLLQVIYYTTSFQPPNPWTSILVLLIRGYIPPSFNPQNSRIPIRDWLSFVYIWKNQNVCLLQNGPPSPVPPTGKLRALVAYNLLKGQRFHQLRSPPPQPPPKIFFNEKIPLDWPFCKANC